MKPNSLDFYLPNDIRFAFYADVAKLFSNYMSAIDYSYEPVAWHINYSECDNMIHYLSVLNLFPESKINTMKSNLESLYCSKYDELNEDIDNLSDELFEAKYKFHR